MVISTELTTLIPNYKHGALLPMEYFIFERLRIVNKCSLLMANWRCLVTKVHRFLLQGIVKLKERRECDDMVRTEDRTPTIWRQSDNSSNPADV